MTKAGRFVCLDTETLSMEHICCALANSKHQEGVARKKEFLGRSLAAGLVFCKLDVRGKVFIEFAPAEAAWRPVDAPGYLVIHCLWVSGRFKAQGFGRALLKRCVEHVGQRHGVVAVAGNKPYLTDTAFYVKHGFEVAEQTPTGFDLVCLRQDLAAPLPRFTDAVRRGTVPQTAGVHFEYVHQCPFVPDCLRVMSSVAREFGLPVTTRHLDTVEAVRAAPSPFGTFGVFLNGAFLTHELMSEDKFRKLLNKHLAGFR